MTEAASATMDLVPCCKTVVTKIASRCNLDCTYCYMYHSADDSYKKQPVVMSEQIVEALIARVASHCTLHDLDRFVFVLHGGEPLLAGKPFFREFVRKARATIPRNTRLVFRLQTNGTLLTAEWCTLLNELDVHVGISVDGPELIHDQNRVDHIGNGSYASVMRGWRNARSANIRPSMLSVINLDADPVRIYEHVKELDPIMVDFLFPDLTHESMLASLDATPYADWLLKIFYRWASEGEPRFQIRIFERIMRLVFGCDDSFDIFGRGANEVLVVETDGSIESLDVLKVCYSGVTATKYNVLANSLDESFENEIIRLYYASGLTLCAACNQCSVRDICGGGYLPHRYSKANGFNNPSVFCSDLYQLIREIQHWMMDRLPESSIRKYGLKRIESPKQVYIGALG